MTFYSAKKKKKREKEGVERKKKNQKSSTLEPAISAESYHTELHGRAVSGFLGILAVARGSEMS